jgi:hypothetical protein
MDALAQLSCFDSRARGLRSAHDQAGIDETVLDRTSRSRKKLSHEKAKGAGVKRLELDETKIPVSRKRGRDGDRGNRVGHS